MEGRAVWARWHDAERKLTMYDSTQSPTSIRGGLAVLFGLPESNVEVIAPDVGGGFGPKIMLFYPDELLVPYAAMQLGRPVKWTEDRQGHFTAVNRERRARRQPRRLRQRQLPRASRPRAGEAGSQARRRPHRHGRGGLRRGHWRRAVRGRARAGPRQRQGRRRDRHPEPGPGPRHRLG